MKAIQFVQNGHAEGTLGSPLFDKTTHMEIRMVGAFADQSMDQVAITKLFALIDRA